MQSKNTEKRKENDNKNQDLHKFLKSDAAIAIVAGVWDVCNVNAHFNFKWPSKQHQPSAGEKAEKKE